MSGNNATPSGTREPPAGGATEAAQEYSPLDHPDVYPTTGIEYDEGPTRPRGNSRNKGQLRLVGNVREGQVLTDMDRYEYDPTKTPFENYLGLVWKITEVSPDGRWLEMKHRESGQTRVLPVAVFAREAVEGRWMFHVRSHAAPRWDSDEYGTRCEVCGVNSDPGLSVEEHFTTTIDGVEREAHLRRCIGCKMHGTQVYRSAGDLWFTTGSLAGPDSPRRE